MYEYIKHRTLGDTCMSYLTLAFELCQYVHWSNLVIIDIPYTLS